MIEIVSKTKDGRETCREVSEGERLALYGDEVEITVYVVEPKKSKKKDK